MTTTALLLERHPAYLVPYEEHRTQVRKVNSLAAPELWRYVHEELHSQVIASRAQAKLVDHPHRIFPVALAEHPHVLPCHQLSLARNVSQWVLRALARNPALTHQAAEMLYRSAIERTSTSSRSYVLAALAGNPVTPREILVHIQDEFQSQGQDVSSRPWAALPQRLPWRALLANPSFPLGELVDITSLGEVDYQHVLQRPNLTPEELGQMRPYKLVGKQASVAQIWNERIAHLPPDQRETFDRLLPGWSGTLDALIATSTLLFVEK